jgi:hypothetical protein
MRRFVATCDTTAQGPLFLRRHMCHAGCCRT